MASEAAGLAPGRSRRTRLWLPLLLPGLLVALSVPFFALVVTQPRGGDYMFLLAGSPTLTHLLYLGTLPAGLQGYPLGWYWVGVLAVVIAGTAAWYRDRIPLRGYLTAGLVLVLVTAALPLAGLGTSAYQVNTTMWTWLTVGWQQGAVALLAIAVSLGLLAWLRRSRALAIITGCYVVVVVLGALVEASQGIGLLPETYADPLVLFPAAVLILAGLGTLLAGA
jgi:hypothetical protein